MKHLKRKLTAAILSVLLATSSFTAAPISVTAATTEETEADEGIGANETDEVGAAENDSVGAAPTRGTTGDCTWEIDEEGTLTISGNGSMKDSYYYDQTEPVYWWERDIKKLVICNGVTSIGAYAFFGMNLTSITIPDSVTSIGSNAFNYCTNLTSITISDSVTSIGGSAFENTAWYDNQPDGMIYAGKVVYKYKGEMPTDTAIAIKDGTKGIAAGAFGGCTGLTSLTIPDSLTSIGGSAFDGCTGLNDIYIEDIKAWCGINFYYYSNPLCYADNLYLNNVLVTNLTIPDGVTSIGDYAFEYFHSLTGVTIPDSVTSIGESAFSDCSSLTDITIPDSVTSIGRNAFENTAWYNNQPDGMVYAGRVAYKYKGEMPSNTAVKIIDGTKGIAGDAFVCRDDLSGRIITSGSLTSIDIPNSVINIGACAFGGCAGLTSITIPNSVTTIGGGAFCECSSLTSITVPNSVTSIDDSTFYECSSLTSVSIPDSVTSIGWRAFSGCTGLTSVNIPNSVTAIGENAFSGCAGLTSIDIPNGITYIREGVFVNCTGLKSVTIPDSVTIIGSDAFGCCTAWTSVTIPDSVTTIGSGAFSGCSGLTSIPKNVTYIGASAFSGCTGLTEVTIPDNITSIEKNTFEGCTGLTNVIIPNGMTTIKDFAFSECTNLERVTIPDSMTYIGYFAFSQCDSLTSVTIPNSVNSLGFCAFANSGLVSITIPGHIYFGDSFGGCENLKNITYSSNIKDNACLDLDYDYITDMHIKFTDNVTSIGDRAFYGNTGITEVEIPKTVESIGEGAFQECTNLEEVTIGSQTGIDDYYTTIGENAFKDCISIDSVYMGENVRMICNYAFSGCEKQKFFVIPNNTKVIQNSVFSGCTSLERVRIGNGLSQLGEYVFKDCYNLSKIDVQEGNKYFYTINGSLYGTAGLWCYDIEHDENGNVTKVYDESSLIWYNRTSEDEIVTIPENVYRIRSYAFQYADNIITIYANKDLEIIDEFAFCYNEFKLHLYDSLNSIGSVYVDDIYYQGTKEQWDEIDGTEYIDYDYVTMHFLDSELIHGNLYESEEVDDIIKTKVIDGIETEFKESWFEDNSYYNHDISKLCSEMVVMGYHAESNIIDLKESLNDLDFTLDEINMDTGRDEQNYFIASRTIEKPGKDYNLVFCGCIGSHGMQWNSDFDPWGYHSYTRYADKESLKDVNHIGFNDAKNFIEKKLSDYFKAKDFYKDNTILLLTGHSRGAAAANLLAADIIDNDLYVTPDNLFTYTFATPNCTHNRNRFDEKYRNIYNIVFPTDFVTKMLPRHWGYGRYGETYNLPTKTNDSNYSTFINKQDYITGTGDFEYTYSGKMIDYYKKLNGDSKEFADYHDGEKTVWEIVDELTSHVHGVKFYYNQTTWVLGNEISPYYFFITFLCPFVNGADDEDRGLALQLASITEGTYYWDIVCFFITNAFEKTDHPILNKIGEKLDFKPRFHSAHYPETYCSFMLAMDSDEVTTPRAGYIGSVNCPVDIEITEKESGEVVGRIVDNTVDEEIAAKPNSVVMTVDGDEKEFWLPGNGEYDVRLIGNDNGVMDYTVREIDPDTGETNRVNYYNVPVEKDKAYTDFFTSEKAFVITAENGSELTPDEAFNSENEVTYSVTVTAEGSGTASDSLTVPSGDYVTLTASPVESEFLGWYQNDTLVSTDLEYRFRPTEDISLTAKFTGEDLKPVEFGDVDVDGEVTISDATQLQMYLAELVELEDVQVLLSDYNLDGSVDISDATQIQLKLAELI